MKSGRLGVVLRKLPDVGNIYGTAISAPLSEELQSGADGLHIVLLLSIGPRIHAAQATRYSL